MTGNRSRSELERIEPNQAIQMYLDDREHELSDASHRAHTHRLDRFADWCEEESVENMNELTGRDVQAYKIHRRKDNLAKSTLKSQLDTFRVFLKFCVRIDAVVESLPDAVESPKIGKKEGRRDDIVPTEKAKQMLEYWRKYQYASVRHTLFVLLWETGVRLGSIRALDVDDVDFDELYLDIQHRPSTPLKNKESGERPVAISPETAEILRDYIETNRHDKTDEDGREPLFSTQQGRASKNCLRSYVYQMTRPCVYTGECPHEKNPDDCQARNKNSRAYECPSSTSTHSVRRGSITHHLKEDVPEKVVSDRMDVSQEVLDKHYDSRTKQKKMEQRRGYLDNI